MKSNKKQPEMNKKKDKAQVLKHTKKRPSSSSNAAAALGGQTGFRGFSRGVTQVEGTLSTEFGLAFKKLSKKDSTTKLKGLAELATMFKTMQTEEIKVVLHSWVTSFLRLSLINNLRVRVALHKAFAELLAVAKKELAPFLKSLIGPWLCHMFDPCKEVSVAAQQSFKTAIPVKKHSAAFTFCKKEILAHIEENLGQTIQTLSGGKAANEKTEERYSRVISSSILALGHFITTLPDNVNEELVERYNALLDQKFWKFLSIKKFAVIRKATYQLIPVICTKLKPLFEKNLPTISSTVLGILADTESDAQKQLWEALLTFLQNFPQSWTHVDPRKHVLPKLWTVLRSGGCGAPSVVYPSLLPLLSLIPPSVIGEGPGFHTEFFKNLWKGLESDTLTGAGSASLVTAFAECVTYFLTRKREAQEEKEKPKEVSKQEKSVPEYLLCQVLIDAIKQLLELERPPSNLSRSLADVICKVAQIESLQGSVSLFWTALQELALATISSSAENVVIRFTRLSAFLALLSPVAKDQAGPSAKQLGVLVNESCSASLRLLSGEQPAKHQLDFLASMSQAYPAVVFGSYNGGASVYLKEQLVPWSTRWKESEPFEGGLAVVFTITGSCLDYAASQGNEIPPLWSLLVDAFISSHSHLLLLLQKVCHGESANYVDPRLDEAALRLTEILLAKDALSASEIALLAALIMGAVTKECIAQIAEGVALTLDHVLQEDVINASSSQDRGGEPFQRASVVMPLVESIMTTTANSYHPRLLCNILQYASLLPAQDKETTTESETHEVHPALMGLARDAQRIWGWCRKNLVPILPPAELKSLRDLVASSLCGTKGSVFVLPSKYFSEEALSQLAIEAAESLGGEGQALIEDLLFKEAEWRAALDVTPHRWADLLVLPPVATYVKVDTPPPPDKKGKEKSQKNNPSKDEDSHPNAYEVLARMTLFSVSLGGRLGEQVPSEEAASASSHSLSIPLWLLPSLFHACILAGYTPADSLPTSSSLLSLPSGSVWNRMVAQRGDLVACLQGMASRLGEETSATQVKYAFEQGCTLGGLHALPLALLLPSLSGSLLESALHPLVAQRIDSLEAISAVSATIQCVAASCTFASGQGARALRKQIGELFTKTVAEIVNRKRVDQATLTAARQIAHALNSFVATETEPSNEEFISYISLIERLYPQVSQFSLLGHSEAPLPLDDDLDHAACSLLNTLLGHQVELDVPASRNIVSVIRLCVNRTTPPQDSKELASKAFKYHALLSLIRTALPLLEQKGKQDTALLSDCQNISKTIVETLLLPLFVSLDGWRNGGASCMRLFQQIDLVCNIAGGDALIASQAALQEASTRIHKMLFSPSADAQKTAYKLLYQLLVVESKQPPQPKTATQEKEKEDDSEVIEEPPMPAQLRQIIEDKEIQVSDGDDAVGYLLAWTLLLDRLALGDAAIKSAMSTYFRQTGVLSPFLFALFHHIDLYSDLPVPSSAEVTSFSVYELQHNEQTMQRFALNLYLRTLTAMPVLVRLWWTDDCDRKLVTLVDKYTTSHMSPALIENEIASVIGYTNTADNFKVKGSAVSREVVATYEKDDMQMSIVIRLPASYPLRSVEIECTKRLGVSESQWRKWMLSMTTLFLTQDGSVLDAVLLWKQNLDKHFEGVECCPICYSVVHLSDYSLPRLACRTCHNKFHSACVYKWVRLSHNTECPLCKSPIV